MTDRATRLLLLYSIFIFLFASKPLYAQEYEKSVMIIEGRGEVTAIPDIANINISVETTAENARAAVEENASKTNTIILELRNLKGESDVIRTSSYSLNPVYEYDSDRKRSKLTGYRVTNQISLTTYDLESLGVFIDSSTKLGANRISGPYFDISTRDEYRRKALSAAVADARTTAETVADSAGVRISEILRITPSYSFPSPFTKTVFREAASSDAAQPPLIESGDIKVEASVNIVFGISQ